MKVVTIDRNYKKSKYLMYSSNILYPIAMIGTTNQACSLLHPLCQDLRGILYMPEKLPLIDEKTLYYHSPLKNHLADIFLKNRALVFCLAAGAVVRLIAPLLKSKTHDPAIIVIDPEGKFVISLCGGHQGGADKLTKLIASYLNAEPVITGVSNTLNLPGIDILGFPFGWRRGAGKWKDVNYAIACQKTVQIIQEGGSFLWRKNFLNNYNFKFSLPDIKRDQKPTSYIIISHRKYPIDTKADIPTIQWYPRVLWIGIGSTRGASYKLISDAISTVFDQHSLAPEAIAGIASVDLKKDEIGIIKYCQIKQLPFFTYSVNTLDKVSVPNPSAIVKQELGTASVAEAAAIYSSNYFFNNDTVLLVSKQIVKFEDQAVTIAIAQSSTEYIGRQGKLYLVGIGPGSLDQITPAAKKAIAEADAIVGYSLYLDLIKSLFHPGQIIEDLPITEEEKRAERSVELAQWGLNVVVISSGDCGIYAMGGLVLEKLKNTYKKDNIIDIKIFPGITALQAAAARVGTPLMHDFCAISLSDLLTPWSVIKKRLKAAAQGDFVTAIYNPKSKTRTHQIIVARAIFLKYRDPNTPVALVRCAYRKNETIVLTTLNEMLGYYIDMLTTVLIGNHSTFFYKDLVITPRGYHHKKMQK